MNPILGVMIRTLKNLSFLWRKIIKIFCHTYIRFLNEKCPPPDGYKDINSLWYGFRNRKEGVDCLFDYTTGEKTNSKGWISAVPIWCVRSISLIEEYSDWSVRSTEPIEKYSEEDFLDFIEFVYEKAIIVSDKSWEYQLRQEYVDDVNKLLYKYGNKFKLTEEGEIVRMLPAPVEDLKDKVIELAPESDGEIINHAYASFSARKATIEDKKRALAGIYTVLEKKRPLLETHFKDVAVFLFRYANEKGKSPWEESERN